jgi:hypothetical protein
MGRISQWYSYLLTAAETDTVGPLALRVTGAGCVQQNLVYDVLAYGTLVVYTGTNILAPSEGAIVLRCEVDDPLMLLLLEQVDGYIEMATGRDWALDATIHPLAKAAARLLLVKWHEDPGMTGSQAATLAFGLTAVLTQLEALGGLPEISGVPEEKLRLVKTNIGTEMAITANLVLVFNHPMAAGATSALRIEDASGSTVTTVNSLDVTSKIMTLNPSASLTKSKSYRIVIDYAPDIYGQTLYQEVGFWTEE